MARKNGTHGTVDSLLLKVREDNVVEYCGVVIGAVSFHSRNRWVPASRVHLFGFTTPMGAAAEELSAFIKGGMAGKNGGNSRVEMLARAEAVAKGGFKVFTDGKDDDGAPCN